MRSILCSMLRVKGCEMMSNSFNFMARAGGAVTQTTSLLTRSAWTPQPSYPLISVLLPSSSGFLVGSHNSAPLRLLHSPRRRASRHLSGGLREASWDWTKKGYIYLYLSIYPSLIFRLSLAYITYVSI